MPPAPDQNIENNPMHRYGGPPAWVLFRERHCEIGKSPLPAARLCKYRLACQNASEPE